MRAIRSSFLVVACVSVLLALAPSAQATAISGTTYTYPGDAPSPCYKGSDATFVGGVYGSGYLNNGVVGNQAYLDSDPQPDHAYGSPAVAYQIEGDAAWNPGGIASTGGIIGGATSGSFAIEFNLGTAYNNLSTVTLYTAEMNDYGVGIPWKVTVSDGVHANVVDTSLSGIAATDGPDGRGLYRQYPINISSLSGQFITVTETNNSCTGGVATSGYWFGLTEVQFQTVPEPSTLVLIGTGLLGLLAYAWRRQR